jgi:putative component of toxin-antitoxin plasmid stabilization module
LQLCGLAIAIVRIHVGEGDEMYFVGRGVVVVRFARDATLDSPADAAHDLRRTSLEALELRAPIRMNKKRHYQCDC